MNNQHPAAATTTLGHCDLRSELATTVLLFVNNSTPLCSSCRSKTLHTAAAEEVSFMSQIMTLLCASYKTLYTPQHKNAHFWHEESP